MTTYPDIPFVDGQIYTPDIAYLAFHQSYGDTLDQDLLGNHPGITDDMLSQTGVLSRVNLVTDSFKPSHTTGLTVNVKSGVVFMGNEVTSIAEANILCPDNATSYIFIRMGSSALEVNTRIPAVVMVVAKVVTSGGTVTTLTDLRQAYYRRVFPASGSVIIFGGQSTEDKTCTAGEVLDRGLYYFRDFIVPAGISITVSRYCVIKCSGRVDISGTINVTTAAPGAIGDSGTGYNANQTIDVKRGSGIGTEGTYGYGQQGHGSGANSARLFREAGSPAPTAWGIGNGGNGGGGLIIQAAQGIDVYGTINANGSNATNSVANGGQYVVAGSGGGSGGFINLASTGDIILRPGSVLNAKGSNGGNAAVSAGYTVYNGAGGGGGAGGVVLLQGNVNTTGSTIDVSGGTAGSSVNTGAPAGQTLTGTPGASFMTAGGTSGLTPTSGTTGLIFIVTTLPLG